ncbi:hypothetical protein SAY86_001444 [Trapa natans]|uniref:Uncharacterized protein n=1 Tax=Trapa natans TaxID=22666 RepID=A0AAN7N0X5_TRANT|nr:hypothetical protein SAY86_001444 [Trapa natans]
MLRRRRTVQFQLHQAMRRTRFDLVRGSIELCELGWSSLDRGSLPVHGQGTTALTRSGIWFQLMNTSTELDSQPPCNIGAQCPRPNMDSTVALEKLTHPGQTNSSGSGRKRCRIG